MLFDTIKKISIITIISLTLFVMFLVWQNCGKQPSSLPQPRTGSINVMAQDTSQIDSIYVELDNISLGRLQNPKLIQEVLIGYHFLHVYNETSAGTTITNLRVMENTTTQVEFRLDSEAEVGPYVGNVAPDFTVNDLEGNEISISGMANNVILLVFFEYT